MNLGRPAGIDAPTHDPDIRYSTRTSAPVFGRARSRSLRESDYMRRIATTPVTRSAPPAPCAIIIRVPIPVRHHELGDTLGLRDMIKCSSQYSIRLSER